MNRRRILHTIALLTIIRFEELNMPEREAGELYNMIEGNMDDCWPELSHVRSACIEQGFDFKQMFIEVYNDFVAHVWRDYRAEQAQGRYVVIPFLADIPPELKLTAIHVYKPAGLVAELYRGDKAAIINIK